MKLFGGSLQWTENGGVIYQHQKWKNGGNRTFIVEAANISGSVFLVHRNTVSNGNQGMWETDRQS